VNTHRFDFSCIGSYSGGFVGANYTTKIVSDTFAETEEANVISFPTEITGAVWGGNLSVVGDLAVGGTLSVTGLH
jgi:hypothetical protein